VSSVLRASLVGAVAPLLAACASSPASKIVDQPTLASTGRRTCSVKNSEAEPLIVEWESPERAKLESMIKRGVVAVRYEGCEMQLLPQCRAPGAYRYSGTERKQDRVRIQNEDDLFAKLPMGAAKLEGDLRRAGELNVAMTIVGRYEAERARVKAGELDGDDCAGATHVIAALTVGAFDFFAGADASVGAGVGVSGVGAGARSAAVRTSLKRDGKEASCEQATRDDRSPPVGCGALVRLEVVPLGAGAARPAAAVVTKVDCPDGSRWDGSRCVRTEVVSECPAGSHKSGNGCAPDVDKSCASGMHFEDGRGCVANTPPTPVAKPAPEPG
jgi:hypothetical protein